MGGAPPPASAILCIYAVLGLALSFGVGRVPGTVPDKPMEELWLTTLAICLFVLAYSVFDVMGVGGAKSKSASLAKKSCASPADTPEEVLLAQRAQANQVEQMPGFITSALFFSAFVNGMVGGVLATLWAVLRISYSRTYRESAGVPFKEKGLAKFTIPCYFILNSMAAATAVHMVRFAVTSGAA